MKTLLCICLFITYLASALRESTVQESIHIYLEDTHALLKPRGPEETDKVDYTVNIESCSSASFTGGTAANNKEILKAHKLLCSGIDKVNICNNTLYRKWFGCFTTARESKVKAVYKKMRDGLEGNTVTYVHGGSYCVTNPNWYGYTWRASARPGLNTVWICPPFYPFPISCGSPGTYTKEFGLIHEWSHAFGDTFDHIYGSSQSQNLAKTDPDKAVENADNYGWHYCEWQ
uniref:Lysine-specific metallo-endopeptidase domain-containing protein n=1 Tax=Amphimedon queenslandica TaxID=400682 RepID=A0A1X7UJH1_AMPQE